MEQNPLTIPASSGGSGRSNSLPPVSGVGTACPEGIAVSPNTVARLLHDMGYSLQVNQKQISTSGSPHRNLQFEYLAELRYHFQRRHAHRQRGQ